MRSDPYGDRTTVSLQVLRRSDGERPELGATVTVHYQTRLASTGAVVDDTRAANAPVTFECGQGDVIPGRARAAEGRARAGLDIARGVVAHCVQALRLHTE